MNNVLITGGAGFIGSNLGVELVEKGYNVTVLDCLSPQIQGNNADEDSFLFLKIIRNNFLNNTKYKKL